jgi:hypothetical protein
MGLIKLGKVKAQGDVDKMVELVVEVHNDPNFAVAKVVDDDVEYAISPTSQKGKFSFNKNCREMTFWALGLYEIPGIVLL